jgi:hypothetical protein
MEQNGNGIRGPVIASWDDLASIEAAGVEVMLLPETSAAAGRDVFVKVRAISPLELVRILNFPMDEINAMVQRDADVEEYAKALGEHSALMTAEDLLNVLESTIRVGLVEPDPASGDLKKLSRDFMAIFQKVVALTMPKDATAAAARFRPDGERGSD